MKVLNFILAVMFLAFAFLQINDPDPVIWILIYGAMAVLSIMAIFNFYPKKFLIGLLILYIAYGTIYTKSIVQWIKSENKGEIFDEIAKMNNLYIEESREFLGLFICILVLIFYLFRSRR